MTAPYMHHRRKHRSRAAKARRKRWLTQVFFSRMKRASTQFREAFADPPALFDGLLRFEEDGRTF